MRGSRFAIAFAAGLVACGAPAGPGLQEARSTAPSASASARGLHAVARGERPAPLELVADMSEETDYLAIGPRELLAAIEPLLAHRAAQGHRVAKLAVEDLLARRLREDTDADAIAAGIRAVASKAGENLRYVLLVGDVVGPGEQPIGFTQLPAFYLMKVGYSDAERGGPRRSYSYNEPITPETAARHYPSDMPYAYANRRAPGRPELAPKKSPRPLAVGRVPARTPAEAAGFAKKAIGYDASKAEGSWRRRLEIIGGPANFGPVADFMIESTATQALDNDVPYDYDVRVSFLKMDSPYMLPYPEVRERLSADLNAGALIAAYVGHGAPTSFAYIRQGYRYYAVGTTEDAEALRIPNGKPFFISITCSTGEFDLPDGMRSLAEGMILNPEGPIAVFASSRESHPYPNALYGQAFVETFLKHRPASIGEGLIEMKQQMLEGKIPLAPLLFNEDPEILTMEHEGLYNLFGDPATKLRYPGAASVSVSGSSGEVSPGASITVAVEAPSIGAGTADLTVETRRSVIRGPLVPSERLRAMPETEAWAAIGKNYAMASDKVVARASQPIREGKSTFHVKAPLDPGEYELKALVSGGGDAAAGSLKLIVAKANTK